jgi:hypothetical protein
MNRILLPVIALMAFTLQGYAQEAGGVQSGDTAAIKNPVSVSIGGYASWLHTAMFEKPSDTWINSTMLHNRLNLKAYPGRRTTIAVEIRNRFITGDMVRLDPGYAPGISADPGWIDLSWNISDGTSYVLNTMIDRAWIDFTAGGFQITAGRQRINWSQALVWNPNDIFNTYSFFDFDYIERPGSDAVRAVYATGPSSAVEAVVKLNNDGKLSAAALYRFSLFRTDLQFLAGETDQEYFTAGTGWSGAIGSWSIRGEATWFRSLPDTPQDRSTLIATAGVDKVFSDRVSVLAQVMYSNNPLVLSNFSLLYDGTLKADQLAFSEFSAVGQVTYTPMPLLNISLSAIWYPDLHGWYAGPSVEFSLAENVGFSFVWQHFNSEIAGERTRINVGFLRVKYSF